MGYNTSRVQIPAAVRLEIENQAKVMRNLQEHLKNVFAEVEPGSAIEKSLNKIFDNMDRRFEKIDDIFKEEIFSEGDLARVNKIIENLSDSFSELDRKVKGARLSSLGVDLTEVKAATEALRKLQQQIISIKGRSVASVINNEEQLKTFVKASKDTGFKGGESYGKNIQILSEKAKDAKTQIADLKTQYEELSESAEASAQQSQLAASAYAKAGRNLLKSQTATEIADIGRVHKNKDARFSAYDEYFKQKIGSGDNLLTDEGKDFAALIGEWLEVDADELLSYADKTADEVVRSLSNALRVKAEQHKKEFGGMNVLQNMAKTELEANKAAGITTAQLQSIYDDAKARMVEASAEAAEAESNMAGVEGNLRKAEQLLALIESHLEELRKLNSAYNKEVDDNFSTQVKAANDAVKKANEAARTVKTTETSSAADSARRIRRTTGDTYVKQRNKNQKDVEDAHEAERFEAELKSSLSHWFSAQQAINMIKDGLRQAWTDIKGLDKAMTNIAVVTDMSVSDLWGKIDQYMAIAQEYGVTTQGVYEVSQLYYQQGLSASEVMEATTETLKMARIAGMDYAEAADAMTVAIRAFKMEMSDAQVITDVYSKVAAVTASDSQELAIAMSKTASSAESVGSSFENTTAMLAVMIETTRESAQNLGSALKSIISRYGEMKVGMTVDSEGEAIDYNKVDTALKSVGISIKDAQGQFRDFDDVIFELSEKWDTLDKNTQRYIATIMAGNRQQSRFIALVDSGDRLKEVMDAAHNSADAGLLQYAKTLDSLETKLNALSTSFQQFYMNIVNGDTFKWLIDLITNVLNGLNKIGTASTILTGVTLVKALKTFATFVLGNFSSLFAEIRKNYKALQDDLTRMTRDGHAQRMAIENGSVKKYSRQNNPQVKARQEQEAAINKAQGYIQAANIAGSIATITGTALTGKGHERWGSGLTGVGNTLSAAGTGASLGIALGTAIAGPAGAIAGAKIGALIAGGVTAVFSTIDFFGVVSKKLEFDIEKAKENAEKKNLDRATAAEEERNLKSTIENLKKLQEARYQSAEAEQAYIEASKEALASFPELEAQLSSSGDVWIDVLNHTSNAEELLAQAREKTRKATLEAAAAERDQAIKEQKKAQQDLAELASPEKIADISLLVGQTLIEQTTNKAKGYKNQPYGGEISLDNLSETIGIWYTLSSDVKSIPDFIQVLKEWLSTVFVTGEGENITPNEDLINSFIDTILQKAYPTDYENVSQLLGKIQTAEIDLSTANQRVIATDKASILAYLEGKEGLNTSQKDLLAEWIYQNKTDADFQENNFIPTTEGLAKGIAEYEAAFSNFGEEQKKIFDEAVIAFQKGQKTYSDLAPIITDFFGGYDKAPQVIKEWLIQQSSDFSKQAENFGKTLFKGDKKDYSTVLKEIPSAFYGIITDYSNWLTANVKSTDNPLDPTKATNSLDNLLNIMAEATNEELALLGQSGTDITSITGLHNFISTLEKSGVSEERLEAWKNFTPAVQNFTTEWASFSDTATSQMQLFEEKVGKAIGGMDIKEATEMAGHLGITLADFSVRNGKFFLDNLKILEEKYITPLDDLAKKIKDAGGDKGEYAKLAEEATKNLEIYKKDLYLQFYLANGKFEEAVALFEGLTDDEKNELETYLKTGEGKLSANVTAAIQPHLKTINKVATDSLSNVWSAVAGAFGTDAKFFADETNRHIYQQLVENGILTGENDVYTLNENLDEKTLRAGLEGTDTSLRNKIYQSWHDQKDKSTAIFEDLYNGKGEVDYSYLNDLATKLNTDAYDFINDYFEKQANGLYKIASKSTESFKEFLTGHGYTNEQIAEILSRHVADQISSKKNKKDFLQDINLDSTIDDLMEAYDEGWLNISSEMLSEMVMRVQIGASTVYKELSNAFASQDDFKIGEAIRLDELTSELNDTFNSFLSDPLSASVEDLRDLHKKVTKKEANASITQEYADAIQQARDGNVNALREYILALADLATKDGVDIDTKVLQATLADAAQTLASKLFGYLESAIEGTLSATNLNDLSSELQIDLTRYTQSTLDGYKISTDGMLQLGQKMMEQYGETYGVAEKMFSLFVGESGVYKGYRDLAKAAEELNDNTKEQTKELEAQKKLLNQMSKIALFNKDDPLFNFMDQDPTKGLALTAQSMADTIDKVKDAFESLKDGENISATDFYNMMDFMYKYTGGWDNLVNALGISDAALTKLGINAKAGEDVYSQFVNAIVGQSKILGEVDADVLMKLGISAEGMAKGMSESLKVVAEDQIDQLKSIRETLVAMKKLEALGDIELDLGINATDGTALTVFNFDQYLDQVDITKLTDALQEKLQQVKNVFQDQGIVIDWSAIFGEDGFVATDPQDTQAFKNLMHFVDQYGSNASAEVWTAMATKFTSPDGTINWQSMIEQIVSQNDWGGFAATLSSDVAERIQASLTNQGIEVDFDGSTFKVEAGQDKDQIVDKVKEAYSAEGYDAIEIDVQGDEIRVSVVNATVKAQIEASSATLRNDGLGLDWQYLFDSDTYQATATIDDLETVITVNRLGEVTYQTKTGKELDQNNVKEFLNNNGLSIDSVIEEGASAATGSFKLTLEGGEESASVVSTIEEDVAAIRTALENPILIEVDDQATGKLQELEAAYISLVNTLEARPLVISTQGDSLAGISSTNSQNGEQQTDLPTLEQKIKVTWEGLDDWKQENLTQSVKVNYTNIGSWKRSGQTQEVTVNYTVGTVEKPNLNGTNGGTQTQSEEPKENKAKGNVNLLKLGAAYARGTLMGELGPELYVQKGAYHIAGANGPEFVDLDPDAIVFNHLQTANLLGKGHTSKTGSPVTSERRSVAFATGNVSGPAMASGLDDAIAAIDRAIAMWQNIANSTTQDLLNGSGKHKGGGSGNTLKAVTEELQEWYNLTRQIRDLEDEITNLQKERANIPEADGEKYLKSLREEQKLLNQQMATQQALLDYQELQLKRQADHINQNRIWSQFLTVGEDGLLQYIEGNETNGGKGALQVLQELNQMSAEQQTAYLKSIGYSYTDNDGNKLEGTELVEKFFEEMQAQIDQYDSLYDTVHQTEGILEDLQKDIQAISDQIKENQMELEQAVFDIIVEAWEKEIEQMEEQADLIKEANDAYINGLNNALSAERQMYDDNQKTADREQLQRQLSLLRRSGGSASEIADLEEQLNDMLKDEYFSNQERMIEDIQQANDIQVQQLETQIRLQEEALEYQKENGVIWTQVYEVLSKSRDEILAFMQGNSTEFFSQSLLQQEQMLTEWAHKIGIYKEDQKYQNYANHGRETLWDNGQAWNLGDMSKYQSTYNNLTEEEKNTIRDQFTSVYANARLDGKSHEEAAALAAAEVSKTLKRKKDAADAENNTPPTTNPNPQNPGGNNNDNDNNGGGNSGGGSGSTYDTITLTCTAGNTGGSPKLSTYSAKPKQTVTVTPNANNGYAFDYLTYNGNKKTGTTITPTGQVKSIAVVVYYKKTSSSSSGSGGTQTNTSPYTVYDSDRTSYGTFSSFTTAATTAQSVADKTRGKAIIMDASGKTVGTYSPSGSRSSSSGSSSSTKEGWHYQLNGPNGERIKDSTAYSSRSQAQSAGAAAAAKKGSGWKYSTKWYMHGGLVDYTGLAMVHGSKTRPESFLNAEQTAQIREGLETTSGKSSALEGIKDTLLKLNSSIQSLTNITNKTESNTYTIAPGAVVIQVEQLNDAYDVDTLSADIMNRMYAIGNKSTNRGVSRR